MSLLASLRASLSLETAQFETGAKRAQRTARGTAASINKSLSSIKSIGAGFFSAFAVGALTTGIKSALEYAGSLGEVSQQLGVTTRDLQTFRYAAGQTGVDQKTLETGLQKLTITLGKVAAGAKAPAKALGAIGLSARDVAGLDTGDAFRKIADGLQNIGDRSQRAAVEVALFGKSGAQLDNLLSGGSAALNELARAAETLGIVLSDEQIEKADETADKLEALKTVLSARIAGVVADNADSILGLADALGEVLRVAGAAIGQLAIFRAEMVKFQAQARNFNPFLSADEQMKNRMLVARSNLEISNIKSGVPIRPITTSGGRAGRAATGDVGQFLAGGGGRSKRSRDDGNRKQIDALRDEYSFNQDLRRADIDILRAKQDLAHDYVERAALSIEILNLEKQGQAAEMAYQVELNKLTKGEQGLSQAKADQLTAAYDKRDTLERQAILEREEEDRQRDYARLEETDFDLKRGQLERQAELAQSSAERRDIELRILDLAYREERARLTRIMQESKDWAEIEEARRRLLALAQNQSADRAIVMQNTAGPFEQWQRDAMNTSDAMEQLKVQGIEAAADSLMALSGGFQNFRDVAVAAIKDIIAQLIRMQIMKMFASALSAGSGGPSGAAMGAGTSALSFGGGLASLGFANGGAFTVMGRGGIDRNTMSINGLPIANVSRGERVTVSNDNPGRGMVSAPMSFHFSGPVSRETQMQVSAAARKGINQATRKGI